MKKYFVTGIGTDVGKTICSAILVEALKADYWKPIQAGDLHNTDTQKVKQLVSNTSSVFHPESYLLNHPMSPHAAAKLDGVEINLAALKTPETKNTLIIEGAGGLMVPLNDKGDLVIDLIQKFDIEVILVSSNYLGSINHTLLSIEALKSRNISIKGIIFNGESIPETEEIILKYSGINCLAKIPRSEKLNAAFVKNQSEKIKLRF